MTILFVNGIADGASPFTHLSVGGAHILSATGNFDGASVNAQVRSKDDPNSEWTNVTNGLFTAADAREISILPSGYEARGLISSAGASTDVFMEVRT